MALVLDTCVLLDLRLGDPTHGQRAVSCLSAHASWGFVVCPVTLVELAPVFHGDFLAARKLAGGTRHSLNRTLDRRGYAAGASLLARPCSSKARWNRRQASRGGRHDWRICAPVRRAHNA
jgi:hypothetical protein